MHQLGNEGGLHDGGFYQGKRRRAKKDGVGA